MRQGDDVRGVPSTNNIADLPVEPIILQEEANIADLCGEESTLLLGPLGSPSGLMLQSSVPQPRDAGETLDDDYSTDSSLGSLPQLQHQQQPDVRPTRRRRPSRMPAIRENSGISCSGSTSVLPEVYRHSSKRSQIDVWSHSFGMYPSDYFLTGSDRVLSVNLEDLVEYSSVDLFSRAWPLVPAAAKHLTYPPFSELSELPEILNVRHPDTDLLARFMRLTALEMTRRHTFPSAVFLRSILVRATACTDSKKAEHTSFPLHLYTEESMRAKWEDESQSVDESDQEEEEGDFNDTVIPLTDANYVDSLDWSMAILLPLLHPRIPFKVLRLLHHVVDQCGINSSSATLRSQGLQRLTRILLIQTEKEALLIEERQQHRLKSGCSDGDDVRGSRWLASAITFLFKLVLASKKIDILLSILRWVYRHYELATELPLKGFVSWITCLEVYVHPRMRVPLPVSWVNSYNVPLAHSLELDFARSIVGVSVVPALDGPHAVIITKKGMCKLLLKPPYSVICRNEDVTMSGCSGVFIEGDKVAVQSKHEGVVTFYDLETLQLRNVLEVCESGSEKRFQIYHGMGRFVSPHYYHNELSPLYPCFDSSVRVEGVVEPSSIFIPPGTDSLSVQFFLCILPTQQCTSLDLVRLTVAGRTLMSVRIALDSRDSSVSITFQHGDGEVVGEIRECVQEGWALWSATLTPVNDMAVWTVYKNGVLLERTGRRGVMFKPLAPVGFISFLDGTFSGFISGIQIWHQFQTIDEILSSASGRWSNEAQKNLLCFFKMNEGVGCCFRSSSGSHVWRGMIHSWCMPHKSSCERSVEKSEVIPYVPHGDYYMVTNEHETVIVEDGFCTWVNEDGRVLEQKFINVRPDELYYYCTHTSQMYSFVAGRGALSSLRWVETKTVPAKCLRELESVKNGVASCEKVAELRMKNLPYTPLLVAQYLLHRLNTDLLSGLGDSIATFHAPQLFTWNHLSPQTLARLVDMCEKLVGLTISSENAKNPLLMLLCVCGRLLIRQLSRLGRGCPSNFVSNILDIYTGVSKQQCEPQSFLAEVQMVFSQLRSVFLMECVSPDYRLKLILEANKLTDVKDLLGPEHLPPLVASMIEKNMMKPFITFLNRLKDECLMESELVLQGNNASFKPSSVMLATLLGMFSQKKDSKLHLVCVALVNSLCNGVLSIFERMFPAVEPPKLRSTEQIDKLKHTSLGIVVFPIAHLLLDLEVDRNVAVNILTVLNKTREKLTVFAPVLPPQCVNHSFTETHRVFLPGAEAHKVTLDLRHACGIELLYEQTKTEEAPQLCVSLLTNEYKRVVNAMNNRRIVLDGGGQLEIDSTPIANSKDTVITVNVQVEIQTESTHWLRDICFALSHTILRITHQLLLADLPDTFILSRESLFRGGLSHDVLRDNEVVTVVEERLLDRTDQTELIQLCEETGELISDWKTMYSNRRIPHQKRLEPILRVFCAVQVWHSHRPKNLSLQKLLEDSLEFMRKKSSLILEVLQQKGEESMLARADFLLKKVNPRARIEFIIAEYQQTEMPFTSASPLVSASVIPNVRSTTSIASFSHDGIGSPAPSFMRCLGTGRSSFSTPFLNEVGSVLRPRNPFLGSDTINEGIRSCPETLSSQILNFILYGYNDLSNEEIIHALVHKTQQATIHTAAYRLQEELCVAHQFDEHMTLSIVGSHLLYRELAYLQRGGPKSDNDDKTDHRSEKHITSSRSDIIDSHYIEPMIGCGFQRELELQKASCGFVHSVIQQSLKRRYVGQKIKEPQNGVGVMSLCTLLCHPWESVDMSIIRPANIFCVLKKHIFSVLDDTIPLCSSSSEEEQNEKDIWWSFLKKCGILGLSYRCAIIPNALQPAVEKVSIVEGDTLGVLVEDADVCCLARNHWRALSEDVTSCNSSTERDCFASYLSGTIVADMPEILYFEMTLEILLSEQAVVFIGVSASSLSSTESVGKDTSVAFCSDGLIKYGHTSSLFGKSWSVGDVIGCGVMAPFNSVFFTCNGEFLGIATRSTFNTMIPFVATQAMSTLVKLIVNFGEHTPFKFDIASLHSSCRTQLISPAMLSDTAFLTAHYFVTLCFKNLLRHEKSETAVSGDSVCALLEEAAGFLRETVHELLRRLKHGSSESCVGSLSQRWKLRCGSILLARLFRTVNVVIDCFRFSEVTHATHLSIIRLCSVTLIDAHDRWARMRGARCLWNAARILRQDYFGEVVTALRQYVMSETIVNSLAHLACSKMFQEHETAPFIPLWVGGKSTAVGKGAFFGSTPLPSKGRHMVGFRIRRRQQEGRGVGAPLGGCYYVGLTHGHPLVSNMANLIGRDDVYVLQDTDDQDQVPHLLLRRHCIPRSSQRRIYGNDEIVWVELNADVGEITYYRDKMVLIGLAFANLPRVDDLYPFVFHFNDDASCELIQAPAQTEDPCELFLNGLCRSVAIHTLQQLHTLPYFSAIVSQWIHRCLLCSHQNIEKCLVALAVLGGEKSRVFCHHETYGAVVVEAISDISSKAIVYLEGDGDMRLFCTDVLGLKSSFIRPPLFLFSETESMECCRLLVRELCRNLHGVCEINPFINVEEEQRSEIEELYLEIVNRIMNSEYMTFLVRIYESSMNSELLLPDADKSTMMIPSTSASISLVNGQQPVSGTPVTIDRRLSSPSLFTPNPSIGVTTSCNTYSVVRGNVILEYVFSFAVSITATVNKDTVLYVGVSSDTEISLDPTKVASCTKTWALCSCDSQKTNSVNCSLSPGMITSSDNALLDSGDVIVVDVDLHQKTVSFSRIRNGKRDDFGVLFDNVSRDTNVRPFVLTGPDSVVVFSFLDCRTFPVRNVFPRSSINGWSIKSHSIRCTSCEEELLALRYDGENGVRLCHRCFNSWKYPKIMFHPCLAERDLPDYLVSRRSPKELLVGNVVEFMENTVFTWSRDKSVNVDINGGICIAKRNAAFGTLEPFTVYDNQRVDILLSHVSGVDGFSFGGLHPFSIMWQVGNTTRTSCTVESDTLLESSTIIPCGTKVVVGLKFFAADKNQTLNAAGLYVGVTNILKEYQKVNAADLKRHILNHNIWGTWCDFGSKTSFSVNVYISIDMTKGSVMVSSSLSDLYLKPVVVTCNFQNEDETSFRVVVFSNDRCYVTSTDGFVSLNDEYVRESSSRVAVGLIPEDAISPEVDIYSSCFLFDTVARNPTDRENRWVTTPLVQQEDTGVLFSMGDTITLMREGNLLAVYRNGLVIAIEKISEESLSTPQRVVVYLSTCGMVATLVPPLYGKSHIGKIVRTFGMNLGLVECMCPTCPERRRIVRRGDVRFCAPVADSTTIEVGTRVAFKAGSFNLPMCGTVTSTENDNPNICDEEDRRTWFSVDKGNIFSLSNEGTDEVPVGFYSLLTPPSGTVTRVFEVGKTKYRLQRNGSYNGIIFDVETKDTVVLTGLAVMSHTTGRHRVEVFFKKGTHHPHENDSTAWTPVFSNFVGMCSERQFPITFPGIHVEANTTFALYINSTHNCGVGYYSKEDGSLGAISSKMDSDDTLTVLVGRTSESSTPFTESSSTPRGFCGSIMYIQNRGTKSPLMERKTSIVETLRKNDDISDNVMHLKSYPRSTCVAASVEFTVEVFDRPIEIQEIFLPIFCGKKSGDAMCQAHLPVSLFYAPKDGTGMLMKLEQRWVWVHHEVMSLAGGEKYEFRLTDLSLRLSRGVYLFSAVSGQSVGVPQKEGNLASVCFLKVTDDNYTAKNSIFSVRGFAGVISAVVTSNIVTSGTLCTISTGCHLSQSNSASYNGIMFDLQSRRNILLEEVFCVPQTTTDNVNVKVFWREGSIRGAEKLPLLWQQVVSKDLYLADKQPFSPGPLNLELRANQVYAIYINTTSSSGVRFYNNSDGHVGDVGDEFEDDGVLIIYVGKKSESASPFTQIPTEPRAIRGHITYRSFIQKPSLSVNQASFPALKGFVVTRLLGALIAYASDNPLAIKLFEDEVVIASLSKLVTLRAHNFSDLAAAESLMDDIIKGSAAEELSNGIVTLMLSEGNHNRFSTLARGDLAVVAQGEETDSVGKLVRLIHDPDKSGRVLVKDEKDSVARRTLSLESMLPITECLYCHEPFTSTRICRATQKVHVPAANEEEHLVNVLTKHFSQRFNLDTYASSAWAKSLLHDPASCIPYLDEQLHTAREGNCSGEALDSYTIKYMVPRDLLFENITSGAPIGFVCPFVYSNSLDASVSISFTPFLGCWKIGFISDFPLRSDVGSSLKIFLVSLRTSLHDGFSQGLLVSQAICYLVRGGQLYHEISNLTSSLHYSCLNTNGSIHFFLQLHEQPLPPLTPRISSLINGLIWANDSDHTRLDPGKTCELKQFSLASCSKKIPRFCKLRVTSEVDCQVFFFEVKISSNNTFSVWHFFWLKSHEICRNFSLARDEELNIAFTIDGDFAIYDDADNIRCHVTPEEFRLNWKETTSLKITLVNVGPHPVVLHLYSPGAAAMGGVGAVCKKGSAGHGFYSPQWRVYDSLKVNISRDGQTASCNGESSLAVIGSPLPMTGLSAFVIEIDRTDRTSGESLDSGHFAGIAVSTYNQLAPHFSSLREQIDSVWAVQDVYDGDSQPTQRPIPNIGSSNSIFVVGTKLHFFLDNDTGTLLLARDDESPRVIFSNIPPNTSLSPFVRLDHVETRATLKPFSCNPNDVKGILALPSKNLLNSHPITPTFIRRLPYSVVLSMFPVFRCVINQLPSDRVAMIEEIWGDPIICTRFSYRFSVAVQSLVVLGAFSKEITHATIGESTHEVNRIIKDLSAPLDKPVVVFRNTYGSDTIFMLLPDTYEVLGFDTSDTMVRLLYFDKDGPSERTLHIFSLESSEISINRPNPLIQHPSVMSQIGLVQTIGYSSFLGVITLGWYNCCLDSVSVDHLNAHQQKVIAKSILSALEYLHLRGLVHGHVHPKNVYIKNDDGSGNGDALTCTLWNVYCMIPSSRCISPWIRVFGSRDMRDDISSCASILSKFKILLSDDTKFAEVLKLMNNSNLTISKILDKTRFLEEELKTNMDSTAISFRTDGRLHTGTGSYNGIMFDVISKRVTVKIIRLSFFPDSTTSTRVTLFARDGSFVGVEADASKWKTVLQLDMELVEKTEAELTGFVPIVIPAKKRVSLFLHTTNGSGILLYSEVDEVKADMAAIEEEDGCVGISVGKRSESRTPFTNIQVQKRFLKGSITYVLSPSTGRYRNEVVENHECMQGSLQESICGPFFFNSFEPSLVLDENQEECLLYSNYESCNWVKSSTLQQASFNASSAFEHHYVMLQKKFWGRMKPYWGVPDQCPCIHQLYFHRRVQLDKSDVSSVQQRVWWVSDPIEVTCLVSLWQWNVHPDTRLFMTTSPDIIPTDFLSMGSILERDHLFIYVDDWERSVTSFYDSRKLVKKLRDDLSKSPLFFVFGPMERDSAVSAPVVAFITTKTDDLIVTTENSTTSLVSLSMCACFKRFFWLDGVMVKCCVEDKKPVTFSAVSLVDGIHDDVRFIQLPLLSGGREIFHSSTKTRPDQLKRFLVETYTKQPWMDEETITLLTESHSFKVLRTRAAESFHHGPSVCTVTNPVFGGRKAHKVELLISSSAQHPVNLRFQHKPTNWCVDIPLPFFDHCGNATVSPSSYVRSVHLCLLVFPWAKRAFAVIDGGMLCEVLLGLKCPSEFELDFSLEGPVSFLQVLRWRVLEMTESKVTRETLDTIWNQLKGGKLSSNVLHSAGVITRHSRNSLSVFVSQNNTLGLVSQIEAAIVYYARQLLGAVIMASRRSNIDKRLLELLPFTSLRSNLVALESLVTAEIRRSSFFLIGTAYASLAAPIISQNLEQVETSVNVIYVSLENEKMLQLSSTAYGSTLMLLLLRTATMYTRSVRHMALRCVLKLLKQPSCSLPSHEILSASFVPLLAMMNGLCQRGKMSSIVVQLGISIICELIRRYQLERPTLLAPGKNSAVPYAIVTCIKVLIHAITSNPPHPLPKAFTHEPKEHHRINYELHSTTTSADGFKSSYAIFYETFHCTYGTKKFEVVLGASRTGNVVFGWDMNTTLPGSRAPSSSVSRESSTWNLLPSCGYCVDHTGKVFVCLSRKKEPQPLKVKARDGDTFVVQCLYHERAVIIYLRRGTHKETSTRFDTCPNEILSLPVFWAEKEKDATFNGASLTEVSAGVNIAQVYNKLQEFPDCLDTTVTPQSYEFYTELALFCQNAQKFNNSLPSIESGTVVTAQSHDLAGFPLLSAYLGAGVFTNEVSLDPLIPYLKHLTIFDVMTTIFSVVVDLRRKTELFELWKKLKNFCSLESLEKIQNETMRPFRNRVGSKANVIIHTMQARPSMRLGPYPTLMRSIFAQLFLQLQRCPIETFYASPMFTVKLAGFGSTDAGGPYRDILSQIAAEIMTTHPNGAFQLNPLFSQCGRGGNFTVMPNMAMVLNSSQSFLMFEFFGKLLASCFVTKDLLAVEFPPLFWKFLLSEEITTYDLNAIDADILHQLNPENLMDCAEDELEEMFPGIQETWTMFCVDNPHLGLNSELPPTNICSSQALAEQIANLELHKYDMAMGHIQRGFNEVIPLYTLNAFRWQQVELMICGTPKLSYDALREVCEICLPSADARQFFDVIASMTDEDRMLLLRFTTGQTRLPLKEAIKVQRSGAHNSLPTSSTCFFTLRLPSYSSSDIMRERILYAIRQCKAIDTDGQAREHIILDS